MKRYHYFSLSNHEVDGLNRMLAQGWRPVRETVTWSGSDERPGEQSLVLLERDDELPIFSGESIGDGVMLEELRSSPLFDGCTDSEIREIVAACEYCRFEMDETITSVDENTPPALHLILSGDVEVHLANVDAVPTEDTFIETLRQGDLFGEVSFFAETEHGGLVFAKSDVQTLCLQRESFNQLLQAESVAAIRLVLNVTRLLAHRLRETDHWMWTILLAEQDARLASHWRKFRDGIRLPSERPGSYFKVASTLE